MLPSSRLQRLSQVPVMLSTPGLPQTPVTWYLRGCFTDAAVKPCFLPCVTKRQLINLSIHMSHARSITCRTRGGS